MDFSERLHDEQIAPLEKLEQRTPLLMAAVVLLFVHSANIDLDEHLPFHAKDDHCYKVTLRNMTVSGEEWQDRARRSQLCARWEIAGHPETATITTFQADADGEIELDGVMPYHALLVSIYLRSKSSSTLRLLGNAALPSNKFIHSGFDGELPLYLRGKAVPGMQVGVSIARPAISQQAVVQRGRSSIRLTVQGNNVLAAEQEMRQELEEFGICFEDDDDDAMMPDDDVMPPEVTCQLAGITFDDDVVLESDFQKDCGQLGITFVQLSTMICQAAWLWSLKADQVDLQINRRCRHIRSDFRLLFPSHKAALASCVCSTQSLSAGLSR
eukprot:s733_g9.t1